jgi:hypothetical protein
MLRVQPAALIIVFGTIIFLRTILLSAYLIALFYASDFDLLKIIMYLLELSRVVNGTRNFCSEKRRMTIIRSILRILNESHTELDDETLDNLLTADCVYEWISNSSNERYHWDILQFYFNLESTTEMPIHFRERKNLINRRYIHSYNRCRAA